MAISLTQEDYWSLLSETDPVEPEPDAFDMTWKYPEKLGWGSVRQILLQDGLELEIADYQLSESFSLHCPEREHPLEYSFFLSGGFKYDSQIIGSGQYVLFGSGVAPQETSEWLAAERILEVNVHIDPALLSTFWHQSSATPQPELQHLLQPNSPFYYSRSGAATSAMQTVLHQILQCPFDGIIKRIYLESKVWELMALLIDQERLQGQNLAVMPMLKRDDVDRIHHAREILLQRFDNPPSLLELAHQVGLNDCTLKRGFRQVFGNTAFGYLHEYRLQQARQLLEEGCLNVSEVARRIGFANRSYFASAFRKKFGVSPKEYLVRHKNSA